MSTTPTSAPKKRATPRPAASASAAAKRRALSLHIGLNSVNGADYGLYLNVETLDSVALPHWFSSTEHLYEGTYDYGTGTPLSTLEPGGEAFFEVDEGDEDDRADLQGLIAALQNGGPLASALGGHADLHQMVRMLATEAVLAGEGFATPLREADVFPNTVIQMVRVGERTGELSDQLKNVAGFFEEELSYAVDKLTQYFEPVIILFIGVVVGFVALAMISAMYGIYSQVET